MIRVYHTYQNFRTQFPHLNGKSRESGGEIELDYKIENPCRSKGFGPCAREESRTPTGFTPQASETCASTNFATRAKF